jgi:hypothetical protein
VDLRQGDALSCILFNIALEMVVSDPGMETTAAIDNKTIQILAYADDIVLVGRTTDVLKDAIRNLSEAAKNMILTVNLQKTKYKEVPKRPTN